ncbi:DUF3667 domain-containing protein [Agrilutibacter solisilvae]|uniref:DUF3667 domain-containing protein n=1 Tax=Agrilutibacter solisilvae TaxID=2763317 RepID=A0A975ATQ4_9GAMM|nr:DUF3667 domain-containing protein [Lysobacter solisilvae]QSX79359.1 DUF3667 domain-containing protein [Lysobacter solisilvae]
MSASTTHAAATDCENCGTPLQGEFCHACGQGVHSPVRSFAHALEEIFESFWHLDGRVFQTLRDLMSPGRVACNYLAGQRVRYVAPIRLFVLLSLLTFFVGKLTVHLDQGSFSSNGYESRIEAARTVAEVERIRDQTLAELAVAEKEAAKVPGVNPALVTARVRIQGEASDRIAELRNAANAKPTGAKPAAGAATPARGRDAAPAGTPGAKGGAASPPTTRIVTGPGDDDWSFNGRPWDEKTNPVDVGWLPGFADRWLNRRIGRAKENVGALEADPDRLVQMFMGTLPTALFLFIPVFALLLKVFYLGSRRLYLEHVAVALYSHAWLLLMLMGLFLLSGISEAFSAGWVSVVTGLATAALWIWMPIYLFVMQRRVYGQHWAVTLAKYLVIGAIYVMMISFATAMAFLAGMVT